MNMTIVGEMRRGEGGSERRAPEGEVRGTKLPPPPSSHTQLRYNLDNFSIYLNLSLFAQNIYNILINS